jgi:two-component system chemotaxis response regulator CheB
VEDSELFRDAIVGLYEADPQIRVAGTAGTAEHAVRQAKALNPDVVSLDLGLPDADGFEVCRRIMAEQPTPILVLTATLNPSWRREAYHAISLGAIDVVGKPTAGEFRDPQWRSGMCNRLKLVARAPVVPHVLHSIRERAKRRVAQNNGVHEQHDARTPRLIVVVGSAGSPRAITNLLAHLRSALPLPVPTLVVFHVGLLMGASFARYLSAETDASACALGPETTLEPGTVYVAPGGCHVELVSRTHVRLFEQLPAARYVPSLDHLLCSVAKHYRKDSMGFILSGMGDDGAQGMLELKRSGAAGFAQNEHSCLVASMPRAAKAAGGIAAELTIEEMSETIRRAVKTPMPGSVHGR